jgi:hypothetical protein
MLMPEFEVVTSYDEEEIVYADYFRVVDGVLFFRNERKSSNEYPEVVKIFNRDAWSAVTPIKTPSLEVKENIDEEVVAELVKWTSTTED